MNIKKTAALSILLLSTLSGCADENAELKFKERKVAIAKLKNELFKECLVLASKIERKADDDVSDIINSCSNITWTTASDMIKRE